MLCVLPSCNVTWIIYTLQMYEKKVVATISFSFFLQFLHHFMCLSSMMCKRWCAYDAKSVFKEPSRTLYMDMCQQLVFWKTGKNIKTDKTTLVLAPLAPRLSINELQAVFACTPACTPTCTPVSNLGTTDFTDYMDLCYTDKSPWSLSFKNIGCLKNR